MIYESPSWKTIKCIEVNSVTSKSEIVSTFKLISRLCSNQLQTLWVQGIVFDEEVWESLIDLVNTCKQLVFLHIHDCDIVQHDRDGWRRMRPIFSLGITNCCDPNGRYCNEWNQMEVKTSMCLPLSDRSHVFTVRYNFEKEYRSSSKWTAIHLITNDRHKNIARHIPSSQDFSDKKTMLKICL